MRVQATQNLLEQHTEINLTPSQKRSYSMRKRTKKVLVSLAACLVVAIALLANSQSNTKADSIISDGQYSEYYCGIENNQLYIEPVKLETDFKGKDVYLYSSLRRQNLVSLDNYGGFTYITYTNDDKTSLNEILLDTKLPPEASVNGKQSFVTNLFNSNDLVIEQTGNTVKGKQQIPYGYLYTAVTSEKLPSTSDFKTNVESEIVAKLKYAEPPKIKDVIININGLGRISLDSISELKSGPGIYYGTDKILRLYNFKDDLAYVWITNINNSLLMNTAGNMRTTEYNNVYADGDFNKKDRMGYKTYSIMTKGGIYSIKLNEKAPDGMLKELLSVLNIKKDDAKIELPFKISDDTVASIS